MSLFTENMRMITAVVIEDKSDAVIKSLLELGALDFVQINNLPPEQMARLSKNRPNSNKAAIEDARHRIDNLLRQGKRPLPSSKMLKVQDMNDLNIMSYTSFLNKFSASLSALKDEQKSYSQKLEAMLEMKSYVDENKKEYLDIRTGKITSNIEVLEKRLSEFGSLIIQKDGIFSTMTLSRDSANVSQVLEMLGWEESADSKLQRDGSLAVIDKLSIEIMECTQKKEEIEEQVAEKIQEQEPKLLEMWCNLRLHELSDQIRSYFKYTNNTTLFSGWVPTKDANKVETAIFSATDGQCVIDWTDVTDSIYETIPVAMKSPKIFRPFEKLVSNYGTPEYGSINPTPFVAAAYLSMFLLMFADLGQGFILFLIGLGMTINFKKNPMKPDGIINRGVAVLMIYLGIVSMIGGIIFGSCFGYPIIHAVWFNYHEVVQGHPLAGTPVQSVMDILGICIKYGIIIIFIGLGINWINLLRKRRWGEFLFSRTGVSGTIMYLAGLYVAFGYVRSGFVSFSFNNWITIVLISGAIGILIKEPFIWLTDKKSRHGKSFSSVVSHALGMWIIELLETFISYMSNTLSFLRVAGMGIAHVSLMGAFEQLSTIPGTHTFAGIAIFVAGNVLVITLEGLSAGIQALRLNYYEFFSKFFNGTGIAYSPVSLRSADHK
ncbi:MAG: ATPase [Spirochaetaceae bacterium]|nr:ATPase [Spirochaetaceae bacterium]